MTQIAFVDEVAVIPNPGGQKQFAEDWQHDIVGLEGGWYSGKSFIGARKLDTLHEYNAFDEEGDATFVPSLVVAPTYSNAMDFCVPHLQDGLEEVGLSYRWHGSGTLANGKYSAPAITIPDFGTHKNPSAILIRTADVPKRITGFTVGAAWGDEPARWKEDRLDPLNDPFIQMTGRVRATKARRLQILLTYTNEGDATRIYEEMHAGKKDRFLYRAASKENPAAEDFVERQKGMLTAELAVQYLLGKAISLRGGKVYPQFDMQLHIESSLVLRPEIPLQISLDFQRVPGMFLEVGQYHPDADIFTMLHEIHGPRLSVQDAVYEFISLVGTWEWDWNLSGPLEVYGDATGRSEWTGTGESNYFILQQVLKQHNIPYRIRVPRANPLVNDRINAFNVSLLDLRGEVHYKIHPRCKHLISDLHKLQRDKYGEIDKTDRKLSHPSDAEGYKVWFVRPVRIESSGVGGRVIY